MKSKQLQALADTKDPSAICKAADANYTFDTDDPYRCRELVETGIKIGVRLARRQHKLQKESSDKVRIWQIHFPDYIDDDGLALFVGTEFHVEKRLEKLESRLKP